MTDSNNPLTGPGPTSQWFYSQRLRLHYVEWAARPSAQTRQGINPQLVGEKPDRPETLLLLHGVQDHCRTWDWLAAEFVHRYQVLAPDLRGHGDSAWVSGATYQVWDYVYDLWQLIRSRDLAPVTLVAHSYGATIAAAYAGAFPETVEKLVLIEGVGLWPGWYTQMSAPERLRQWCSDIHELSKRNTRRYATSDEVTGRMQAVNPQLSQQQVGHLAGHGSFQNEDGSYSWKFDNYTHGPSLFGMPPDQTKQLWNNIQAPTLILNASDGYDHRIGQDGTDAEFTQVESKTIEEAGHWTYHDQPGAVLAAIQAFGV